MEHLTSRGEVGPQSIGFPEECEAWGCMSGMKPCGWLWFEGVPSAFLILLLPLFVTQPKQNLFFLIQFCHFYLKTAQIK